MSVISVILFLLSAFDQTRVQLSIIGDDPTTDYINSNYLDGFTRKKEYIASQGALPDTCDDFWRMIWEKGSRLIVMVKHSDRYYVGIPVGNIGSKIPWIVHTEPNGGIPNRDLESLLSS
jgi:hypothetical protein